MNNTIDAMYCRLCAELKLHNTLINLLTDEETCQKVIISLSRFNIVMDFQENILPNTVCLKCIKSLEQAFVFVTAVEQAQAFLSDFIPVQINTAASDSCDENMYEPPDNNGIIDDQDEHSQDSMEVNDDGTNVSEKCDSEVKIEVNNDCDYFVINGYNEEYIIENKHEIQPSNEIIEENTDLKDECVETLDLSPVENNKNILKDTLQKGLNSENSPKRLATTVYSKSNINKIQKTKKNSNVSTKNTDIDVEDIKMTWKDYEWKCYYCETLFPSIQELQEHSMQYHNSCNPYQCTDCALKSSNLKRFMKHVRGHKNYLRYSCYKCFKKFPKLHQAGKHNKKVHEDSDYVCLGCNTPFHSNSKLKEHVNKYYKYMLRPTPLDLKCSICNKNTASATDFRKHLITHDTKTDYVCETCGKCFASKHRLGLHIILHTARKKKYTCDKCSISFNLISKLKDHKSIHTGIKPFTCDHCGKSFRTKLYVANHMKIHMDSFLYPCTLCNKKFRRGPNLKNHMFQHTGEKPFSCNFCPRDFANLPNRNKHMRRRHGNEMVKKRQSIIKQ